MHRAAADWEVQPTQVTDPNVVQVNPQPAATGQVGQGQQQQAVPVPDLVPLVLVLPLVAMLEVLYYF